MARYTGPVCKICRREGIKLFLKGERCFTPKCAVDPSRKPYPPGQHAQRRRKMSEYGLQLREKQKARFIYGILERQFRRHFEEAQRRPGSTGENLLRILEMRLDNVVFRLGFADSRAQARQLVTHGHITVDGRKVDIPSYETKVGQVIGVHPRSRQNAYFTGLPEVLKHRAVPAWLSLDATAMTGRILSAPTRADIDSNIQEHLIVEYYSR
ncbi:MAG TPA: 30S ribosomal protein S4 [Chloroflexota bacterium]|jgi:small subunit ribosomal protein S4|nr:30S ribosomal protein S4 [Chloroflexota bacterium]